MATKCSFSFRCTHAARHTPHTCQKSCREGGAEREGDDEGGRQKRRMGISRWNDWGEETEKKWRFLGRRGGRGELRTMVIHEEGEREKMEGLLVR